MSRQLSVSDTALDTVSSIPKHATQATPTRPKYFNTLQGLTSTRTTKQRAKSVTRRRKCACCRADYLPTRHVQKYCTTACRQRAYRARHKPRRRAVKSAERVLYPTVCEHCRKAYWRADTGQARRYCSATCRTMASRARRNATIAAVSGWLGVSGDSAAETLEAYGARRVNALLVSAGFTYDTRARCWHMPLSASLLPRMARASTIV